MIAPFRQIKSLWRNHKYKRMRARKKLPPCDWWDYKYELADFIEQGIDGLLNHGVTDWNSDYHKQEKEDLEFVLEWARDFPKYESGLIALDVEDWGRMRVMSPDIYVYSKEEAKEFDERTKKAFELLARNIHTLWD